MRQEPSFRPEDYAEDLRLCHPQAIGLWFRLLPYLRTGNPYGHLTVRVQNRVKSTGQPTDAAGDSGMVHDMVHEMVHEMVHDIVHDPEKPPDFRPALHSVTPTESEACLPLLLGYSEAFISWGIAYLVQHGVLSRTPDGTLYSPRMSQNGSQWQHRSDGTRRGLATRRSRRRSRRTESPANDFRPTQSDMSKIPPVPPLNTTTENTPLTPLASEGGTIATGPIRPRALRALDIARTLTTGGQDNTEGDNNAL